MHFKNLKIIGTSHISMDSVKQIERYVRDHAPQIVAVELDAQRYRGLISEEPRSFSPRLIFKLGVTGFLFLVIAGALQDRLAKSIGMKPGADMKAACLSAHTAEAQLILIDQNIERTLRRISQEFTFRQKLRLGRSIIFGLFFRKRMLKELGLRSFDLRAVPSEKLVIKMMNYLKKRYPGLYLALVEERNYVMAKRLVILMHQHPDKHILAVVGAGHLDGMMKIIKKIYAKVELAPVEKAVAPKDTLPAA